MGVQMMKKKTKKRRAMGNDNGNQEKYHGKRS